MSSKPSNKVTLPSRLTIILTDTDTGVEYVVVRFGAFKAGDTVLLLNDDDTPYVAVAEADAQAGYGSLILEKVREKEGNA